LRVVISRTSRAAWCIRYGRAANCFNFTELSSDA
jgi:hypothetical protein